MKTSQLILLLIFIISTTSQPLERQPLKSVVCPDEEGKGKYICAFNIDLLKPDFTYIQNNCKKDQKCNLYTGVCETAVRLQNHRQQCLINEDCISGQCLSGKCIPLAAGVECTKHAQCVSGYFCQKTKIKKEIKGHCEKLPYTKQKAKRGVGFEDTRIGICGFGDAEDSEGICRNFGNLTVGNETIDPRACKTGMSIDNVCINVVSVGQCIENEDGHYYANLTYIKDYEDDKKKKPVIESKLMLCNETYDRDGNAMFYLDGYSPIRYLLWKSYLEMADKYDFSYFYEETFNHFDEIGSYNQENLRDFYFMYNYAEYLYHTGIINKNGEVKRKCEFEYFQREFLSARFSKFTLWTLIILTLLGI